MNGVQRYRIPDVNDTQNSDRGSSPIYKMVARELAKEDTMLRRFMPTTNHGADAFTPASQREGEEPDNGSRDAKNDEEVHHGACDPHPGAVGNLEAKNIPWERVSKVLSGFKSANLVVSPQEHVEQPRATEYSPVDAVHGK